MKTQKLPIALPQSKDLFYERKWYFDTAFFYKVVLCILYCYLQSFSCFSGVNKRSYKPNKEKI